MIRGEEGRATNGDQEEVKAVRLREKAEARLLILKRGEGMVGNDGLMKWKKGGETHLVVHLLDLLDRPQKRVVVRCRGG